MNGRDSDVRGIDCGLLWHRGHAQETCSERLRFYGCGEHLKSLCSGEPS